MSKTRLLDDRPLSEAARKAAVEIESELELHPPLSPSRRDKIAAVIDAHFPARPGSAAVAEAQPNEVVFAAKEVSLKDAPVLDLATLLAIHNYFEFESTSDTDMDAFLHAHIKKAMARAQPVPAGTVEERGVNQCLWIQLETGAICEKWLPKYIQYIRLDDVIGIIDALEYQLGNLQQMRGAEAARRKFKALVQSCASLAEQQNQTEEEGKC